jgi:hypothetical protein
MINQTAALLGDVYKNTKMGEKSISALLPKVEDAQLLGDLIRQREEYRSVSQKVGGILAKSGRKPSELSPMAKAMARMGLEMHTFARRDASSIAKMVIQGSGMGTIELCRSINHNPAASSSAVNLARHLLDAEEQNIERLKHYL